MILTCGIYNLSNYKLTIEQFEVEEKPRCYDGVTDHVRFLKKNIDQVRHHSAKYYPYLEVFTLDIENPVVHIQNLLKNWFQNKANRIDTNQELRLINNEQELEER